MHACRWLLLVLLVLTVGGCASPPFAALPAPVRLYAMPVGPDERDDDRFITAHAQAVVHGRRALTVAHAFQGTLYGPRATSITLPEGPMPVVVAGMGAHPDVQQPEDGIEVTQQELNNSVQDWLAFEAERPLDHPTGVRWRISANEPAFGELLHAVRYKGRGRGFQRVPFRRENAGFRGMDTPEGLYFARRTGAIDMRGWSGSFVGRRVGDAWELVGILVGSFDVDGDERNGREVAIIIRPPEAALRWLLGEDVALPGALPGADP
ncbi:MAG: hypothetical protein ACIAS6_01805 [Phycisphaerales bacterium JB060]